jgi:hypothetical protein
MNRPNNKFAEDHMLQSFTEGDYAILESVMQNKIANRFSL